MLYPHFFIKTPAISCSTVGYCRPAAAKFPMLSFKSPFCSLCFTFMFLVSKTILIFDGNKIHI